MIGCLIDLYSELWIGIKWWRFWWFYAWQDVKNKYTRSFIGPFWVTITMSVMIFAMGPLYSNLFGSSTDGYILYLATGLVYWTFISSVLIESCDVFISSATFIRQSNFSLFIYILRLISRNIIILAHNLLIPIAVALFTSGLSSNIFLMPVWILCTILCLFPIITIISIVCTRFRDLAPMIANLIQLGMFITPVFWMLGDERRNSIYVKYNIFYYLIDGFRFSFGISGSQQSYLLCLLCFSLISPLAAWIFSRGRKTVVYWI